MATSTRDAIRISRNSIVELLLGSGSFLFDASKATVCSDDILDSLTFGGAIATDGLR